MKNRKNSAVSDYKTRMDKVFDHIDQNLTSKLSLKEVSELAHFSPFHFHRVFRFITGETLNQFITRRRIEKSALELIHGTAKLSDILFRYGFSDNSSYSRTFKKFYGVNPTEFREKHANTFSKISQQESKNGQVITDMEKYICAIDNLKKWIQMNATIQVKEMKQFSAATLTHIGIDGVENAFDKLIKWANSKHQFHKESKLGRLFYDSLKVTDPGKVRMGIFLITDDPFEDSGEIRNVTINSGKCIVGSFEITPIEFEKSWTGLFVWMNENGFKKSAENPFEIYHNDFREHPENKFVVDLCIPIE